MVDIKTVAAKDKEMATLWTRMDIDRRLKYLEQFRMKDHLGKEVPDINNVTLNIPALFSAHFESTLMAASQQIRVVSQELDAERIREIEVMVAAFLDAADALLLARDEGTMRGFLSEQVGIRGRGAFRVTTRMKDGRFVPELMPIDTRYFVYEPDPDGGLHWGAYTTWRLPSTINALYPDAQAHGTTLLPITDYWDKKVNRLYTGTITGEMAIIAQRPIPNAGMGRHGYGETPIVVRTVPLGSLLKDVDALAHRGESIYFLFRDLIPQMNLLASVLQTINFDSVHGPVQFRNVGGGQGEPPEYSDATGQGKITAVDLKGGISRVETGDFKQAGQLLQTILSRLIQAGSLSLTDFGQLSFPLSAVALVQLGEANGQVFLPRLGTKGLIIQAVVEMAIRQMSKISGMIELGAPEHRQLYDTKVLEGRYSTNFLYTPQTPETDAALFTIAEIARDFLPDSMIYEKILKSENPAEIKALRRIEQAEELDPRIKMFRTAGDLIDMFDKTGDQQFETEALILASRLNISLEALRRGEAPEELPTEAKPNTGAFAGSLFDGPGTRSASNTRATELMTTPAPTVGRNGT